MFRIGSFLFLESFLLGVCTLLTGTELIQDLLVLANGKEVILAAAVPVLLIGAVVSMFPLLPHKKQTAGEPFYLFFAQEFSVFILALLFFPLLILGGFPQDFSGRLLLGSGLIAAVISGTAAGLLYGAFFLRAKTADAVGTFLFALLCGFCGGGILLYFRPDWSSQIDLVLLFALLLPAALLIHLLSGFKGRFRIKLLVCILALLPAMLFQTVYTATARKFLPAFHASLNTSTGRIVFTADSVFLNGLRIFYSREPFYAGKLRILVSLLQENGGGLRAASIGEIDQRPAFLLASMPEVEHVDSCLVNAKRLRSVQQFRDEKGKLGFSADDPFRFFAERTGEYDLFYLEIPVSRTLAAYRFRSEEMFRVIRNALKDDGILAVPLPASEAERIRLIATVRKVFPNVSFATGRLNLLLASAELSPELSPEILADRAESRFGATPLLPPGFFLVTAGLLDDPEETARLGRLAAEQSPDRLFQPDSLRREWSRDPLFSTRAFRTLLTCFSFAVRNALWLLGIPAVLYLLLRYFKAVSPDRRAFFLSFENGFWTFGTTGVLLYLFQLRTGMLFGALPILLPLFAVGGLAGAFVARTAKSARAVYVVSALLPLVLTGLEWIPGTFQTPLLFAVPLPLGFCTAYVFLHFRRLCGEGSYAAFLPSVTLLGGGTGLLAGLILFPVIGLFSCCILLTATRLSRIVRG